MKNLVIATTKKVGKTGEKIGKFMGDNPTILAESVKLIYEIQKGKNYRKNIKMGIEVDTRKTENQIHKAREIDKFLSNHKELLKEEDVSKLVDKFCEQF